jgi:predicted membrane protein
VHAGRCGLGRGGRATTTVTPMDRRPPVQLYLGVLVLAVGVVALLVQLDVITTDLGELIADWWPLAVVGVGLAALVTVPRAWLGPTVIIAVGVFFLLQTLGVLEVNLWEILWPVALILVGLSLITSFGSRSGDDDTINSTVFWWGTQRKTRSRQFKGGSLTAIMGGIEVDLREADIVGKAEIAIFAMWGGVEIKVPPTWRVRVSGLPLLGGWDDKTTLPLQDGAPELVVHVTAIMGGAEIKS